MSHNGGGHGATVSGVILSRDGAGAAAVALALIATLGVRDASAANVVPLPRVSAKTKETRFRGHVVMVVRSILVQRIHGSLTVNCNRKGVPCRRLVGRTRTSRPSANSKRFAGVNWILSSGRAVNVIVEHRGSLGRFLVLVAKRRRGRLTLVYRQSGCKRYHGKHVRCPPGTPPLTGTVVPTAPAPAQPGPVAPPPPVTPPPPPPPVAPPPPPPPPPAAPPATSDAYPCGAPVAVSWTTERAQHCALVSPLAPNGWVPVYTRPTARASGAANPTPTAGWLKGTVNQYFICQREFAGVEYYWPAGVRNRWWAYTLSDDNKWGWTPEVFFQGGNNDERDKGLALCGANHS
jgi:hypothetical protein